MRKAKTYRITYKGYKNIVDTMYITAWNQSEARRRALKNNKVQYLLSVEGQERWLKNTQVKNLRN